jgi:hypothetical protein
MHVCELLAGTHGSVCPVLCFQLLQHAELRGVTDASAFLRNLNTWKVCPPEVAWALRAAYNRRVPPTDRLWVPVHLQDLHDPTSHKTTDTRE